MHTNSVSDLIAPPRIGAIFVTSPVPLQERRGFNCEGDSGGRVQVNLGEIYWRGAYTNYPLWSVILILGSISGRIEEHFERVSFEAVFWMFFSRSRDFEVIHFSPRLALAAIGTSNFTLDLQYGTFGFTGENCGQKTL